MRLKARHKAGAIIPTASMADIAFLLIVFFMVTITFEKDKIGMIEEDARRAMRMLQITDPEMGTNSHMAERLRRQAGALGSNPTE